MSRVPRCVLTHIELKMDDENVMTTLGVAVVSVGVAIAAWRWLGAPPGKKKKSTNEGDGDGDAEVEDLPPRGYTLAQLRPFTGEQDGHILVAISGKVYDVTKRGKSFYGPGGGYHVFAGRDASRGLAKMSLETEDLDNPHVDDLTLGEVDRLGDWVRKFEAKYPVVGHVVDVPEKRNYTVAELREYDGAHGRKGILFALRGKVYDVTKGWSFYGPGGGYSMLGGRDASRALAKMSLDEKDVDEPRIDDLTAEENKTLDEWVEKLGKKYTLLGDLEDA